MLLSVVHVAPAEAQATRTWVSGTGNDANPCSRVAPCKTFAGAISKTTPNGEINVIDAGAYGVVTITKSLTINAEGLEAGVLASGTNGIIVNTPATDVVTLRGLDIDGTPGAGPAPGLNGIRFLAGGALHVQNCLIRNFTGAAPNGFGILFTPSGASELFVSDTTISRNGSGTNGAGIQIQPAATGSAKVSLNRVQLENNVTGVRAETGNSATSTIKLADRRQHCHRQQRRRHRGQCGARLRSFIGDGRRDILGEQRRRRSSRRRERLDAALRELEPFGQRDRDGCHEQRNLRSYGNNRIDGHVIDGPSPIVIPQK